MKVITENLSKRFNREWIFKDLTFQFASPNTYAIVGPNGSGKSTLMQVLWGQMLPSQGNVTYEKDGKKIPLDEIFKYVSIATPYMDLIDEFTLTEMINFHFKFKIARTNKTTKELIELLELTRAKDKTIANFSSGMRQRLKLGLALYSQADLLFLDEPTTNLDSKSVDWYTYHRNQLPDETLVFISSNQPNEYPQDAQKIDILAYKRGY